MPSFRALAAAAALFTVAGCSIAPEATTRQAAAVTPEAPCHESAATPGPARPPALADTISAWFGRGELWVRLPTYPPEPQAGALLLKFPWVTLEHGVPTAALGPPAITATRRGAPAETTGTVGAFAHAFGNDSLAFWPSSVAFPEPGCWTVTGTFGPTSIQFVLDIAIPDGSDHAIATGSASMPKTNDSLR